jgi:hypothetical protein
MSKLNIRTMKMMNENDFEISDYESDISLYDDDDTSSEYDLEHEPYEFGSSEDKEEPVKVFTPQPIQLAAENSNFRTLAEAKTFYDQERKRQNDELDHEEHMKTVVKRLAEEKYWKEIINALPVESEGFKKRRLVQEAEEKEKLVKEKKRQKTKPLPFGHRRNGGKHKKSHGDVDPDVVKQRRAERRRVRKNEKKEEENKRAKFFEDNAVKIEEKIEDLYRTATLKLKKPDISMEDALLEFGTQETGKEDTTWTVVPSKKKKEPLVLKMGVKPFRELVKTESVQKTSSGKTRMCRFVTKQTECAHGEQCRFAHTIDELTPKVCDFGEACKFLHSKDKPCSYIHSFETKLEYCQRLAIVPPSPKVVGKQELFHPKYMANCQPVPLKSRVLTPVKEKTEVVCPGAPKKEPPMTPLKETTEVVCPGAPKKEPPMTPVKETTEVVCPGAPKKEPPMTPVKEKTEVVCPGAPKKEPKLPGTTILKVPKEFAIKAFEMALSAGRKNIKIIIV